MTVKKWEQASAAPGGPLSASDFAARDDVRCSPQEVRSWCRAGMPHARTHRGYLIDPAPALAWLKDHRTQWTGRGGNHGGGRPPKSAKKAARKTGDRMSPVKPPADKWKQFERAMAAQNELEQLERGDLSADADGNVKAADGSEVQFTVAGLLALPPAQVVQLKVIEEVLTKRVERLSLEKTLVPVTEIRKTWSEAAVAASRALRGAARLAASRMQRERGMKPAEAETLRLAIEEEIDQALLRLRSGFLGGDDEDADRPEEEAA